MTQPEIAGYVKFSSVESYRGSESLYSEEDLYYVDFGAAIDIYAGSGGGCNIDVGSMLNIDFNIDFDMFDVSPAPFNDSLHQKANALSAEVAMINEMLINALLDMECCDIAGMYNGTMVPFFDFFSGGPVVEAIVRFAEIIAMFRAAVEPLECLIRFIPNNPWSTITSIDPLAWIYGYYKETKPFLDRLLSGEILDMVINPIHQVRIKLQACLTGGSTPGWLWDAAEAIGTDWQMERLSELFVKGTGKVIDYVVDPGQPPVAPKVEAFAGGPNSIEYRESLRDYERAKARYDAGVQKQQLIQEEQKRQATILEQLNTAYAIPAATQYTIRVHTAGICGCVADAFGINNSTIDNIVFRTTNDMLTSLVGKTHATLTYGDCGAATKDCAKDDKLLVTAEHINNQNIRKKIVAACPGGKAGQKVSVGTKMVSKPNPYRKYLGKGCTDITANCSNQSCSSVGGGCATLAANDSNEDLIKKCGLDIEACTKKLQYLNSACISEHEKIAYEAKLALNAARETLVNISRDDEIGALSYSILSYEIDQATSIYNNYLASPTPINLENDPQDLNAIQAYIHDNVFANSSYNINKSKLGIAIEEKYDIPLSEMPFPINTPPEIIIEHLPIATEVDVDERFLVNYFNSGFVREGGSSSWRNFNRLDIKWGDVAKQLGAIGNDKTEVYYLAIFPNDTIGDQACVDYLKIKYPQKTHMKVVIGEELNLKDEEFQNDFMQEMQNKYGILEDTFIVAVSDDTLRNIIIDISNENGYTPGKLWIKTRFSDPELKFEYRLENDNPDIVINNKKIPKELFDVYATNSGLIQKIIDLNNKAIEARIPYYSESIRTDSERQALTSIIDSARFRIMDSAVGYFPAQMDMPIPCTCENFMCSLLNYIVQYFMDAFNKMLQQIADMITQLIIPDWVKGIMRQVQEFMKCFGSIFGMFETISNIHEYTNDLLDILAGRIRDYPADPCFAPKDPFQPPKFDLPGDTVPFNPPGPVVPPEDGYPDGGTFYPTPDSPLDPAGNWPEPPPGWKRPIPPDLDKPPVPIYPPVVMHPPVIPLPGDPGRKYPAFKLVCNYLDI